jgi:hypothetical protein
MTADGDSVTKHATLHPIHLDEQMSVTQPVSTTSRSLVNAI